MFRLIAGGVGFGVGASGGLVIRLIWVDPFPLWATCGIPGIFLGVWMFIFSSRHGCYSSQNAMPSDLGHNG